MPYFWSIHFWEKESANLHAQAVATFIHRLACLDYSRDALGLIADELTHTTTCNSHLSQTLLPHNKLVSSHSQIHEFKDKYDQSNYKQKSKSNSGNGCICWA